MMRQQRSDDRGLTGLEAAIVLIAFIVIAAVVSLVVFNVSDGGDQAKTIEVVGDVYGLAAVPSSGISEVRFSIRLVPGAPAMNLSTMTIVFSTPDSRPLTLLYGTTASRSVFTTRLAGTGEAVGTLHPDQQVEVDFLVADVPAGTRMNFDLRPPAGALSFFKTAPETITSTNVL